MTTVNYIRQARKAKRLTLQQVADLVGVTKTTVSEWERGQKRPTADRAHKLCDVLPALTLNKIYPRAQTEAA